MTEQQSSLADATALRASAFALAGQGRMLEAERAFSDLLRANPADVDALNFLAVCAHGRGRADEALDLLLQARHANPGDAATLVNLGSLQRERARLDEAQAAFAEAVRLAPDIPAARLRLGEVLEARGLLREALPVYYGAIMTAQKRNSWLSEETTEPALRPLVMHAMRAIDSGRRALFTGLLAPLREMHGDIPLRRVARCLATWLGDLRPAYADPAQRPTFLYMPDLPSTRFFERDLFPWYDVIEAHTMSIRAEMQAVFAGGGEGFEPFFGHRIAEIVRNPDESLAAALLDPGGHRHDFMRKRVAADGVEGPMLGEALERAPSGEDQPCLAVAVSLQDLCRGDPFRAGALTLDDARLPVPWRAARDEEQRVEAADSVELRHPSREPSQRRRIEFESMLAKQLGEGPVRDERILQRARRLGLGRGRQADGYRGFLDGLADRRNGRCFETSLRGEPAVRLVDPAAGKDHRPRGEGHASSSFDHQQLRRAVAGLADQDQGRRRNRLVAHRPGQPKSPNYIPLTFCSSASRGLTVLSATALTALAAFSALFAAAWALAASIAAWLASSFNWSALGWLSSAFWTASWLLLLQPPSVSAVVPITTKASLFIAFQSREGGCRQMP